MTPKQFEVAGVRFDLRDGLGSVPDVADIDYFGFVAFMKAKTFLDLCPEGEGNMAFVEKAMSENQPIGMTFLQIDLSEDMPKIKSHEGRTRSKVLARLYPDVEFPVAFLPSGGMRARHIDAETIARVAEGIVAQRDDANPGRRVVAGPIFERYRHLGEEHVVGTAPAPAFG